MTYEEFGDIRKNLRDLDKTQSWHISTEKFKFT